MRIPELGDKLASRHGQKGVIGMIMPSEDMPFTKEGLVPDIIINPHAIPSRMTIGHLLECVLANHDVKAGISQLYMPFDSITDSLSRASKDNYANSVMYNGITGEQIDCAIFIGPTYYFRLKHMVADKVNSRTEGQMVSLTHQPTKGRGAGGGLRIGEMETNVLISHGIAAFGKESMMERSDKYEIVVDDEGRMFPYNKKKRMLGDTQSHHISLPYSFKLLVQELNTMSIDAQLITE
jgi:DNA-directed RNA polymerase II subunit RPB2